MCATSAVMCATSEFRHTLMFSLNDLSRSGSLQFPRFDTASAHVARPTRSGRPKVHASLALALAWFGWRSVSRGTWVKNGCAAHTFVLISEAFSPGPRNA